MTVTREGAIIQENLTTITRSREIAITTSLATTLTRGSQAPNLNASPLRRTVKGRFINPGATRNQIITLTSLVDTSPLRLTMKSRLINRGGTQKQISLTSLDRFMMRNHHVTGEGAP